MHTAAIGQMIRNRLRHLLFTRIRLGHHRTMRGTYGERKALMRMRRIAAVPIRIPEGNMS